MMTKNDTAMPQVEPLLVRVEEAARILSLSRSTIYELLDRGELPSVRCGAARRIPLAALHIWVEQQLAHDSMGAGAINPLI
jgi:excisionase family DNA binding protein